MKRTLVALAAVCAIGALAAAKPVQDEASAVSIARAALIPVYGANKIAGEEPLIAHREGDIWIVTGTLRCGLTWFERLRGDLCVGGTAYVKLSVKDGRIMHMTHFK